MPSIVGHQLHNAFALMRITPTVYLTNGSTFTQGPQNLAEREVCENPQMIIDFRKVSGVKIGLFYILQSAKFPIAIQ